MVQPTIKKLTKGSEKIKGLSPKAEASAKAKAAKKFPNTTATSARVGRSSIHSGSGASLTTPNARELNIRSSHLESNKLGQMGQNAGRPDTGIKARVNTNVSGKGINPNRPSSVRVSPVKAEGPGKSYLKGKQPKGTGRATISNTDPVSKKDPRVARTQRNMKDMNRAFNKDMGRVSKPSVTRTPAKGGLSMKPLINTLATQGEPTSMHIKKLGVERFADRKGMTQIARTHVARRAPGVVGKAVGRAAVKAVPYVGTAATSAQLGYAAGKLAQSATAKPISGASMASVNPRGMHASQVKSAAEKLKRKK